MKTELMKNFKVAMNKVGKLVDKHSPEILIGCGIAGFITTAVLVAKEAPVAKDQLDELHENLAKTDEELNKAQIIWEEVKVVAPIYAPAIVTGTVAIGCILGSYKIETTRSAALATAYEITQTKLVDYQNKVKETLGENKENKIRTAIAQDKVNQNPPGDEYESAGTTDIVMTDGLSLFYDKPGERYFRSSMEIVRKAEKELTERLNIEMCLPLNELYYELGMKSSEFGNMICFDLDTRVEIIPSSVLTPSGQHCTVIDYNCKPMERSF